MKDKSNPLQLYLLGTPRLERFAEVLHLPRKKQLALLAYLAFGRKAYNRDTLATLLWPDQDDSHARGSLRRLLHDLRKTLGKEILPVEGEQIGPLALGSQECPILWVDIEEFQAVLARGRFLQRRSPGSAQTVEELLGQAVELYRGDFLLGFTLGECGEFSDWQFMQGEFLRREMCTALRELVEFCERKEEHAEGIEYGRRLVEVDPLNEEAHCALMRLYAASGQREAALRQYRLCAKLLQVELGLEPEETTEEQYQVIRHSRPTRLAVPAEQHRAVPRLVVLPFKSLAEEGEQEWFSDGMTDALITELSQQEGLEVRISAQLVEAAADRHVWAESYRGRFADMLQLQEKLAGSIASRVFGTLAPRSEKPAAPEIHSEAREACMMGDYYLRRSQSEEEIAKAKEYYHQALEKDPQCADAYAGLAFTYFSLGGYGRDVEPSTEDRGKVGQFIQNALRIDPGNVRARMVLAGSLLEWDWDWAAAEREFQEALRIDPNHIETLNWYSELKMSLGQFDEQLALVQRACRLNPLDPVTLVHLYRYHRSVFQWRRSLEMLDRIDELNPGRPFTLCYRAWVYLKMGQYDTAVHLLEKLMTNLMYYDFFHGFLAYAFGKLEQNTKALKIIAEMIYWRRKGRKVPAYYIGLAYHGSGMDDKAMHWLEVSFADHELDLVGLPTKTLWDDLHWDARFQDLVRRLGLPLQLEYIRKALDRRARTASHPQG